MSSTLFVTVFLKSGQTIHFTANKVTTKETNGNDLLSIETEGSVGFPQYLRIDDVSAVTAIEKECEQ